jgi:hypothetical protein
LMVGRIAAVDLSSGHTASGTDVVSVVSGR